MQLHVLGPAFGLPSIDAECIAAAALLQSRSPDNWTIIADHDQTRHLPYLIDGQSCLEGFKSIAQHLDQVSHVGAFDYLNETQRASATAITSFLESRAQPLLDISLYVSYDNYSTTRTAFTKILPWYANYIMPPRRRADARQRTEHLGISQIDVEEDEHEDLSNRPAEFNVGKEQKFEAASQKRARSLLLPQKDTLRNLLLRPEHSAVFKLHALAENFFEPLQNLIGDGEYFLGTHDMQTVDCLVYGYLSLMLYPKLPQNWLGKTMRAKYSRLARFTDRTHERLGLDVDVDAVVSLADVKDAGTLGEARTSLGLKLPWSEPQSSSFVDATQVIARDLFTRVPFVGLPRVGLVPATPRRTTLTQNKYLPAFAATIAASLGLLGYYAFAWGFLEWPRGEYVHIFGRKRLADYGHLGAALAGISMLSQQANGNVTMHPQDLKDKPVRVEVEVEKDGLP